MDGETRLNDARWRAFILQPGQGVPCRLDLPDGGALRFRATPSETPVRKADARRYLRDRRVDALRPHPGARAAGYRAAYAGVEGEPNWAARDLLDPDYVFWPAGPVLFSRTAARAAKAPPS